MELNPYQERAVATAGHCTILACPGSGKTRVLSARAARLLANHPKGRLCAVTFTRDAAEELRSRILASCGQEHARRLAVGTFHSLALAQLKRASRKKPPRLLSEGERLAVLRRCCKQHAPDLPFDDVVQAIDAVKARLAPPLFTDPSLEAVFRSYQDIMESEGAMDFADLLLLSVRRMASGDMPPLPIRWLLVDEAQDMDEVQMEWILLHSRAGAEVTLVGDDDQSLYAFRHALGYAGLQKVTFALSATETTLPVNYRCAPNILAHAARLIAHNTNRAPKRIEAHRQDAGEVRVIRAADRWDEAGQCVERIRRDGSQWAVLARTNLLLDPIEVCLIEARIPYRRFGGQSVWDRTVGATFLGLLRSVLDGAWTGVANALAFCGMPADQVNRLASFPGRDCLERLRAAARHIGSDADVPLIVSLLHGFEAWTTQARMQRHTLVIHAVAAWLSGHCKPDQARLLGRLEAALAGLSGHLARRLSLVGGSGNRQTPADSVAVMTLHASKGLEFDNVWILGCEDGNLPHTDSTEEDERRLLYVGMTRARHRLILSSAIEEGMESRFLKEAGLVN